MIIPKLLSIVELFLHIALFFLFYYHYVYLFYYSSLQNTINNNPYDPYNLNL